MVCGIQSSIGWFDVSFMIAFVAIIIFVGYNSVNIVGLLWSFDMLTTSLKDSLHRFPLSFHLLFLFGCLISRSVGSFLLAHCLSLWLFSFMECLLLLQRAVTKQKFRSITIRCYTICLRFKW